MPVAALHDGQKFLVEKYNLGLMPSVNLTDTRYQDVRQARILAMGASRFTELTPLPAVPIEVTTIVQQLGGGESFLNERFTPENLMAQRRRQPFSVIHLATHGEFNPGEPQDSFIQFWNSRVGLDQLRRLQLNSPATELLTLSACRTAIGDERAELGFAGLAVQAGIKTALASLWYVSDEGTLGLMTEFYKELETAPIKAVALRRAQVAMLKGQVRVESNQLRGSSQRGNVQLPPEIAAGGDRVLSHPYFWAAFTLVGSPW